MRFPYLSFSRPVVVDEFCFLDVSKSLATSDEGTITAVNVTPEVFGPTINVWPMSTRGLIYPYSSAGNKTVTVEVVTGSGTTSKTFQVPVVTLASLSLFSDDSELSRIESDINGYLPKDKSSWSYVHYRAQQTILTNLDERGITKNDGSKYLASDISDVSEVRDWATYLALHFIMRSLSNQVDDIFEAKAKTYFGMAQDRQTRAHLKLKDTSVSATFESEIDLTSGDIRRVL